jgi:hypothetical protein
VFLLNFTEFGIIILHFSESISILDPESHHPIFAKPQNPIGMKRRIRKIVNFFAFNLLFFALYLNFIHRDKAVVEPVPVKVNTAVMTGTVPVQDAEKYLNARTSASIAQPAVEKTGDVTSLKLSIN